MNEAPDHEAPAPVELDVTGLEPPEPLHRTLEALARLTPGQPLRMLIDREPRPLYRILERNGYSYEAILREDYLYEITVRQPGEPAG